ncbi:MAG: hypothetical protein KF902_06855 [Phycisphaeraceae bacterium]|nr:hypothetical protein [Phycisphaeraceae bacterium]MCW5769338.1 hypothetical protein [Phycisphaeraceae bacterium]
MGRYPVRSDAKRFPTERLRPRRGEIYAYVFENRRAGVPLGVYWNFFLPFRRLKYREEVFECALLADWATPDVRDWRDLEGSSLNGSAARMIEGSFYAGEHDPLTRIDVRVGERRGRAFRVRWDVEARFAGCFGDDADAKLRVVSEAWMDFDGISIGGDRLLTAGSPKQQAIALLQNYVDVSAFGVLQRQARSHESRGLMLRPTRFRKQWSR